MLQAARLAPNLLRESGDSVVGFLRGQINEDGGAIDRSGASDLYYTVFALEGLQAMRVEPPIDLVLPYLRGFSNGMPGGKPLLDDLDLVHVTCLARCWASMPDASLAATTTSRILRGIESYRSDDGGYNTRRDAETGTVYNCFLAVGAYQDLGEEIPDPEGIERCLRGLKTPDGSFANESNRHLGTTPTTAAAATLMRQLAMPVPQRTSEWLIARHRDTGGFLASPDAPIPDLLSTATAIHALARMNVSLEGIKESCLDFLDSLWTGRGFCGSWADDVEDCEYTYYALLALGHLSM